MTMKKIMVTLAAVACCAMTMVAEPVSPDVVQQAAAKFLQAKGASLESGYVQVRGMSRNITGTVQTEASPYYVFNATDSRGFVIVSGDDCVGDNLVLGYTEQGSFDENSVPANMQTWFDDLAAQITVMSGSGIKVQQVAQTSTTPSVYDLSGRKVQNPQKGIYIRNGKKTIF